MITGYVEYKYKRDEARQDLDMLKKKKIFTTGLVKDLHEIEEFETAYPDCYKRYEKEHAHV